jgi:NAD(P)-dependent dehydrogenase (short-subunit alcohol dehydrogenase family)
VLDINIRGVFATTQAALKHMKDGGRIIMIGSAVGERAVAPGLVPYAATKGAVKMFTQALSREVGSRGITVNNVQPGPIDTDLNPASGDWAVPRSRWSPRSKRKADAQMQSLRIWQLQMVQHCSPNKCAPSSAIDWMCLCSTPGSVSRNALRTTRQRILKTSLRLTSEARSSWCDNSCPFWVRGQALLLSPPL